MESIPAKKLGEVRRMKSELEKKLNVKIIIRGKTVTFRGNSFDEYEASLVFDAIRFGFSVRKALLLKEEDKMFKVIHIKEHTKRNLKDIKARLIGTRGKTRKTISKISGGEMIVNEGEVGVISDSESIDDVVTAVISIIKGSKQSNMYKYLEKMNRVKKSQDFSGP